MTVSVNATGFLSTPASSGQRCWLQRVWEGVEPQVKRPSLEQKGGNHLPLFTWPLLHLCNPLESSQALQCAHTVSKG